MEPINNEDNFEMLEGMEIEPIIRIRDTTRKSAELMSRALKTRKQRKFFSKSRNRAALQQHDWKGWVEKKGYGKRSGLEGLVGSFKRLFGKRCYSKLGAMISREILLKALVWNIMM